MICFKCYFFKLFLFRKYYEVLSKKRIGYDIEI